MAAPELVATNDTELHKTWSIKEVSWEARNAALSAARRSEMTMGEWMSRYLPMAVKLQMDEGKALATIVQNAPPVPAVYTPACTMDDVTKAFDVAIKLSGVTGKKVPRSITRAIERQIKANLGS